MRVKANNHIEGGKIENEAHEHGQKVLHGEAGCGSFAWGARPLLR
jgi:hypothetical protein